MTDHHTDMLNAAMEMAGPDLRIVPKPAFIETAKVLFSLSQTQRREAHTARRQAIMWEAAGSYQKFADCMIEGRRLWREAFWHLDRARMNYERAMK